MDALWIAFNGLDRIFALCAIAGGMLFVVRTIIGLFGGDDGGGDGDIDLGGDVDTSGHIGDSDISFKVMTVQGLTAFFLMFGLVGLALHRGSGTSALTAIIGALVAGAATMLLIAKLTQMMQGLQSSGNVDMRDAIGLNGTAYLNITPGATGQVQVAISGRLKTLDAITKGCEQIKTGERIKVVDVIDGQTLVVEKL